MRPRSLPLLALVLVLGVPAPLVARMPGTAPAPPFPAIAERARAADLTSGGASAQQARADLDAYVAELRGSRIAGWPGWVLHTYKEHDGGTYAVRLAAEDPYAPPPERKAAPGGAKLARRVSARDRPAYLLLTGLPAAPGLRPGQKLYIDGVLKDADLDGSIDVTVERARFTAAPEPALPEAARGDVRDLQITLERGACFGACPVYKISAAGSLVGDGGGAAVTWNGRAHVGVPGVQRAQVDAGRLRQLYAALLRADFFRLRDSYEGRSVTDHSSAVITVRRGKEQKTVRHYHGDYSAPARLDILENQIDALLGSAAWIEAAR
jgi:hypothetical protein